ncbi:hypothetical protein RB195_023775 [Necator americanus]|uniref:Uncharacterized protein n=1 Tax=Necator americanus TaxID=51031 RepID=A0ABR1ELC6_NECAM
MFLFQFKLDLEAAETARNAILGLAQEPLTNIRYNGGSVNSAAVKRALKMTSSAVGHPMLTTTNFEP